MAIGGIVPFVVMSLSLLGYISYDMAIAAILFMFAPALFPALIENYRKKQGWSKVSTVTTTAGQAAIGVIFVVMGLTISVVITAFLTLVWGILMVQAFMYAKKEPSVLERVPKLRDTFDPDTFDVCPKEHGCGCEPPVETSASRYM